MRDPQLQTTKNRAAGIPKTAGMHSWLPIFALSLGLCSGDVDRIKTLKIYNGYPFTREISIPELSNLDHDLKKDDHVGFVAYEEITDKGIRLRGIPLTGDVNDTIELEILITEGQSKNISIGLNIVERDEDCQLYPAALVDIRDISFENRTELFDAIEALSENISYPMDFMRVDKTDESTHLNLHLMVPVNCSIEKFNVDPWKDINRIVNGIENGIYSIDGALLNSSKTREFTDNFPDDLRVTVTSQTESSSPAPAIDGRSNELGSPAETTEVSTSAPTSEEPTTVHLATSTQSQPTTEPTTTTPEPSTTTRKPTTTTTTALPVTLSPTTSTTTEPPTTTSTEPPTTTPEPTPEPAVWTTKTTPQETVSSTTEDVLSNGIDTMIVGREDSEAEADARLDVDHMELATTQKSGASVAMPLFAIIVLLALASAIAVFTVVRARSNNRKTFVIGNASTDEINDVVVLGAEDNFH